MPLFVLFVFGAVILGAGAMLSPAWPTQQPRIGLAAAFSLAIVVGGAVFYASLFEWDTLVIDYLMFALVTGIFLGGTLAVGQARAEAKGEILADRDQGWPGPHDLVFFGVVALVFMLPVISMEMPDSDLGARYGLMALSVQQGGTFDTLAPFHPEIEYLYPPGFSALTAYLSRQLSQNMAVTQYAVAAVIGFFNVWLAYDFGAELRDKRLGRTMAVVMLLSFGVFGAFWDAHYPALMGLFFAQAFFIYTIRYIRYRYPVDALAAGLMMGAVVISHPGMTIALLLGYVPWLATMWLSPQRPKTQHWLVLAAVIPAIALIAISPWLYDIRYLLESDIASPFERMPDNLRVMIEYHGVWIIPFVLIGGWLGWQGRNLVTLLTVGWLFFILDFAVTGGIAALFPFVDRFLHPLDLAWHGPIIPYTVLGGAGLLWVWDTFIQPRTGDLTYRHAYIISAASLFIIIPMWLLLTFPVDTIRLTDDKILIWLKENTESDARILNRSSSWTPVLTERAAIYFDDLPFAQGKEQALQAQTDFERFRADPVANVDLLDEYEIDYALALFRELDDVEGMKFEISIRGVQIYSVER